MRTIDSCEAKTHLPRLLDEVSEGETIAITKHRVPVAMLVPAPEAQRQSTSDVITALREFRQGKTLGKITVRDLVEEGRRV